MASLLDPYPTFAEFVSMDDLGEEIEHKVGDAAEWYPDEQQINAQHVQAEKHLIREEQMVGHHITGDHGHEHKQQVRPFCRTGDQL